MELGLALFGTNCKSWRQCYQKIHTRQLTIVIIKKLEGTEASDSLDEIEVIVERDGIKLQVPLNFIHYSRDNSGVVLPF